jgi:hypothetical protein
MVIHALFSHAAVDRPTLDHEGTAMSAQAALISMLSAVFAGGGSAPHEAVHGLVADTLILAQSASCNAIGEAVAAENGGTLASASDAVQNGAEVCQIIIVVRGQNGERPRRMEVVVPKG